MIIKKGVQYNEGPYLQFKKIKEYFQNKKRNAAINKYGYEMLDKVCQALKKSDMTAFCAYGTLLGFVREGGILSHDLDIDIAIIEDKNFSWDKLDKILTEEAGLEFHHQFVLDNGKVTERTYNYGDATIDFFLCEKQGNSMIAYVYELEEYSTKFRVMIDTLPIVKGITYEKKHDIEVPIIDNYDEYLTAAYGKTWRIPDPNFEGVKNYLPGRSARKERCK